MRCLQVTTVSGSVTHSIGRAEERREKEEAGLPSIPATNRARVNSGYYSVPRPGLMWFAVVGGSAISLGVTGAPGRQSPPTGGVAALEGFPPPPILHGLTQMFAACLLSSRAVCGTVLGWWAVGRASCLAGRAVEYPSPPGHCYLSAYFLCVCVTTDCSLCGGPAPRGACTSSSGWNGN